MLVLSKTKMWYSRENRKFIRTILNLNMAGTTKMICGIRSGFRSKKVKSEFFAVVSILGFSFEVEFQHPARSFIDIYLPTNELGITHNRLLWFTKPTCDWSVPIQILGKTEHTFMALRQRQCDL